MFANRKLALALGAVLLLSAALLWGRDDHLINSALVPAATGDVHTDNDPNGNTGVHVTVDHLARPHDLQPSYSSYVVWVQPQNQPPVNVGELHVDDHLQGKLDTTTPYKKFDVFVTAENDPRAAIPSGPQVMHGTVAR